MNQSRKQFINTASLGFAGLFFPADFLSSSVDAEPVIVHEGEGEKYWIGPRNSPLTIKISDSQNGKRPLSFCTEEIAPGEGIPLHKHLNEDELIFVHTGEGILTRRR